MEREPYELEQFNNLILPVLVNKRIATVGRHINNAFSLDLHLLDIIIRPDVDQ